MRVRFDPTSPLAYSGCWKCGEWREEALLRSTVCGHRQCLNCSTSRRKRRRWGKCVGCGGENLPLEMDHVLGQKYQPVILEPLCRNCHQVKTQSTNHLPNTGDVSELLERAWGAVSAYAELSPDGFLEIPSICALTSVLVLLVIIMVTLNFISGMLEQCKI